MNRKLVAGVVGFLALAFLVWFFAIKGGGDSPGSGKSGGRDGSGIKGGRAGAGASRAEVPGDVGLGWDVDPAGTLRLEGQVLGDGDAPVAGAEVWLSSSPPRTAKTDADGSFMFDKLVARQYAVSARADELTGGPVVQQLTATSAPVVIRMRKGATVTVHVVSAADGTPIAGAAVELREAPEQTARTDDKGLATFKGVPRGWTVVAAKHESWAPAESAALVGSGAVLVDVTILMKKGAAVAGRVVDDAGAPVAGARVMKQDAGRAWQLGNVAKDGVTTNAKGEFTFPAVPAGSFRFVAYHDVLAPGTSGPVTVDGSRPTNDVEIKLGPGGVIAGVVVGKDGQAAPQARVAVAPAESEMSWGVPGAIRQVTADAKGAFTIKALPRVALKIRAESTEAASAIVPVDLKAVPERRDVKLVLDVTGVIAGVVVNTKGQPVAEVQVSATRDFWGGGSNDNWALSGWGSATTDGGGAFTIRGLEDGDYQINAHRTSLGVSEAFQRKGTLAHTGDTKVKVTMPSPGAIKGKLVLASGDAPKLASVSVSWERMSPAVGGSFVLDDLAPGKYDLTVRGFEFAEQVKRDVEVDEGKAVDVGTITLKRGRKLVGKVQDGEGRPIAGAKVRVGKMIFTEGSQAGASDPNFDQMVGHRVAETGADGSFAIVGIPKDQTTVVAEHADLGRSDALKLPAGTDDPPAMNLVLHGFGSVAGRVTSKGQPLQAMVMATPVTGGSQFVSVQAGQDGNFVIDKVSEGKHRLSAMRMGMMQMSSSQQVEVTVVAGQRATVNIDIPAGDVTLAVAIKPKQGATVNAAQVFLFRGTLAVRNVKELTDAFTAGGASAGGMKFWMGQGTVDFAELVPGKLSICSIPITGDLRDPQLMQRLNQHAEALDVHCLAYDVKQEPKQQTVTQELPAMNPLPVE